LLIVLATGETRAALSSPHWGSFGFLLSLFASSVLAFVLNYAIFWNTAVNSALTQTVSGQAKDIVVVALGFVLFTDAHVEAKNIMGVMLGFAGSIVYACSKIFPFCTVEYHLIRAGFMQPTHAGSNGNNTTSGGDKHLPYTLVKPEDAPMGNGGKERVPLLFNPQNRPGGGVGGVPLQSLSAHGPASLNYSLPISVRLLSHLPSSSSSSPASASSSTTPASSLAQGHNLAPELTLPSSANSSPDPQAMFKAGLRPYARHDNTYA
jgi:hypothetical protein